MTQEGFKRKLTSIFSADAVGYSRLMEDDEEATVRTITSYREVIATLIKQHNGIIVDSPGDNLLAEFVSVVDAVQCAVSVQNEINARNEDLPENRKMEFRIGINLGDVIQEGERIYGDGVNIAARLEGLATPGGICISKTAFDQIERKLPYGYEFIGDQTVKNISKPVGAYRVMLQPRITVAGEGEKGKAIPVWRRKAILSGGVALVLVVIGALFWYFYFRPPPIEPASVQKMAFPLPEKPSIVVLPFDNLSKDPDQEYLVDGITDQIITGLSNIPYLLVISSQSSKFYKGKAAKVQQVAEDLGVQYVLEGSVQRSGDRIRITAQLIDALTGHHIWSERYDRELKELFALQDDIMVNIMQAMQLKVAGLAMLENTPTPSSVEVHLKILKAIEHVYLFTKEDNALGRKLYEEAIALDPEYGPSYRLLGWTHLHDVGRGWSDSPDKSIQEAEELANKAISCGDNMGYPLLSNVFRKKGELDKAVAFGEKGLRLNPNQANANAIFSFVLSATGRYEEAIAKMKKAIRLNPHHRPWYFDVLGKYYFLAGQYGESIPALEKYLKSVPNSLRTRIVLTVNYIFLGRDKEAHEMATEILRIDPKFSIEKYAKVLGVEDKETLNSIVDALRKAGLE